MDLEAEGLLPMRALPAGRPMRALTAGSQTHVPVESQLPTEALPVYLESEAAPFDGLRTLLEQGLGVIVWSGHGYSGESRDLESRVQRLADLRAELGGKGDRPLVFLDCCNESSPGLFVGASRAAEAISRGAGTAEEKADLLRRIPQLGWGMESATTSPDVPENPAPPRVDQFSISTLAPFDPFTASVKPVPALTSARRTTGIRLTIDLDRIPNLRTDLLRLVDGILASLRLTLVRVLVLLARSPDVRSLVLELVAACRHYGHRGEPDDHPLPAYRSISVVRGELALAA